MNSLSFVSLKKSSFHLHFLKIYLLGIEVWVESFYFQYIDDVTALSSHFLVYDEKSAAFFLSVCM